MLQDVYSGDDDAVYIPIQLTTIDNNYVKDVEHQEADDEDEDGVGKVTNWLESHCRSSSERNKREIMDEAGPSGFQFKRNSITRRKVRKAEFPGNWKLIPKSIEQFPSRFLPNQCHQTQCDRCDIRNRPENYLTNGDSRHVVTQDAGVELRLQNLLTYQKKRCEVKSQSSDSAIGGSGERLWNGRRIPLLPVDASESEILQDLVQPEDSASACSVQEPFPDYSPRHNGYNSHKSYGSELSQVLRDFEGSLNKYESPEKGPRLEVLETCSPTGNV